MKRIILSILVAALLLTIPFVSVLADNTDSSYLLTAEDEKRLMDYDQYNEGSDYLSNDQLKSTYLLKYVPDFLAVAEEYVNLTENYDNRKIATASGKAEYEKAFMTYMRKNYTGSDAWFNRQVKYILDSKQVKKATFVTDDSCIFQKDGASFVVRGVEYFTITSKSPNVLKGIKTGVRYKRDAEIFLTGNRTRTGIDYIVEYYGYLNEPSPAAPTAPAYSASPAGSNVLVNGKAISFEAYNINGNNYFKLRDLAMAVNGTEKQFEVGWDSTKNAINLTTNKVYTVTGGELASSSNPTAKEAGPTASKVYVNGKEVAFTAYNIGGSNYFKLRDIARVVDFGITWDGSTNTIGIDTSTVYTE